jgi:hypothetical protein
MASAPEHDTPIGALLADLNRLRGVVGRVRTAQIQSSEVKAHIRAVASAWFKTYRGVAAGKDVTSLDEVFTYLRTASERSPSTAKVRDQLRQVRDSVIELQTTLIASPPATSVDVAPSFAAVPNPLMKQVLKKRWDECVACLKVGAPLAATVMMGGLLESLFLARVNRETNLAPIFTAKAAPKDKAGKTWPLKDWGLGDYIAVAHELGWITQSGKDVSGVLQNYRNYIHPQKELSSAASLSSEDARMFWAVFKAMAQRLM